MKPQKAHRPAPRPHAPPAPHTARTHAPRPPAPRPAPHRPTAPPPAAKPPLPAGKAPPTAWDDVAAWYDALVGETGSEYHREVVLPGVLKLLVPQPTESVLDVACGQGVLCRILNQQGVKVTGVDSAAELVRLARQRSEPGIAYHVGDARELPFLRDATFDAAACVLAIQNIHPVEGVFLNAARVLRPGGRFVVVMMHPCFRGPKFSSWGWEASKTQYRRVDRYLLPRKEPIFTHPGQKTGEYTWTFHRPLQMYFRAIRAAGMLVDALEEWPSHKMSEPGPRAAAENTARKEIPMFLALRAIRGEMKPQMNADKRR